MNVLRGVDISRYQRVSSWATLAKAAEFVIVKASEGQRTASPVWLDYSARAKAAKILRGSYHFAHPENSAEAEAEHYATMLRAAGFRSGYDLPPVLDIERAEGKTKTALTSWCLVFCSTVDRLLKLTDPWLRTGIYCNRDFYANRMDGARVVAGRWLWMAAWPHRDGSWPATDLNFPNSAAIWQWTDRAPMPGITTPCDGDVARPTDLRRLAPIFYGDDDVTTPAEVRTIVRGELHRFLTGKDDALENLDNPGSNWSLAGILQNIENDQDRDRKEFRAALAKLQKVVDRIAAAQKAQP